MPSLRTLLVLSRASNLPTVWSNCLAAWWLGGAGSYWTLPLLLLAASALYVGGMFLNDAADAEFDRQHRRERPIPSGQITERQAWRLSFALLAGGALLLIALAVSPHLSVKSSAREPVLQAAEMASTNGPALPELDAPASGATLSKSEFAADGRNPWQLAEAPARPPTRAIITILLTIVLLSLIVVYDVLHKVVTISPILMGLCRTLLFLAAASLGQEGLTGLAVWSSLALGAYVAGLSYFARLERMLRQPEWWPCLLLAVPVALALVVNSGEFLRDALLLSFILVLWIVKNLSHALGASQQNISRSVTGLLAGIIFVDLLAVCGAPKELSFVFLGLFAATLLFQKFIPAT